VSFSFVLKLVQKKEENYFNYFSIILSTVLCVFRTHNLSVATSYFTIRKSYFIFGA